MTAFDSVVVHPDMSMMGGGEVVSILSLRAVANRGGENALLVDPRITPELEAELAKPSLSRIHRLPLRAPRHRRLSTYPSLFAMRRRLAKYRDLQTRRTILTQSLLPARVGRRGAEQVLYAYYPTLRTLEATGGGRLRSLYLAPARRMLEKGLGSVSCIMAVSEFTKNALAPDCERLGLPRAHVVYPASLRTFQGDAEWALRAPRIVYVARLNAFKRHEVLSRLARRMPHTECVSIGSTSVAYRSYVKELRRAAPPNHVIRADAPPSELTRTLETSRVYVHLAPDEHFGIGALEAMQAGCVPIVHESGGIREFVPSELWWRTEEDLVEKCTRLLADEREWRRLQTVCRKRAKEFSPERFEKEFWQALS